MFRPLRRRGVFIPFRPRDEPAPPPSDRKPPPILQVYRASVKTVLNRPKRDYVLIMPVVKDQPVVSTPKVPFRIARPVASRTTAQHLIKVGRR